ncbi:phosphoglycolate phosphatase [Luteimonas kalidii]|uniref:Phosphoglycolate phosphatase n=1 Tax=Luteimonas kalidii TaxID=3042025 RepID=A0ABT6JRB9_9GAMM|nr:phosphoglycolate phosphatase [Luteimonas kalidii]MDH5833212.1 phosphoglycolate phosphatase [Luteimonas kalidii]
MSAVPRAMLFDLDGTLVDSAHGIAWAVNQTLAELGHPAADEPLVRTWIGEGARFLLHRALRHAGADLPDGEGFDRVFALLMRHYATSLPRQARAYPGADAALRGLRERGIAVALCTNKPQRFIDPLLDALDWRALFDGIVGGDTLPECKPSALPLLHLARAFDVPVEACLLVGDSHTDAAAARAAGMPLVLVDYGYHRDFDLQGAGAVAVTGDLRSLLQLTAPDAIAHAVPTGGV